MVRKKETKSSAAGVKGKGVKKRAGKGPSGAGKKRASGKKAEPSEEAVDHGQLGAIMSKSLELAEASINLGMSLVQKLGTSMQDQVLGKLASVGKSVLHAAETMQGSHAEPAADTQSEPSAFAASETTQSSFAGVTNRLPLFPGSPVNIPFSISNDSPSGVKKVKVSVHGFKGELHEGQLKGSLFAVRPASKEIGPADFEKFVVTGVLPVNIRGDAYWGEIIVGGDEQLIIPLKLLVMGKE